jgi:phage-related protein
MGSFLKSYDPIGLSWIFENGLWVITLPVQAAKGILGEGVYDLASGAVHGLLETGVSGVNGIAEDVGGVAGFAVVGLFTGIAAAAGSAIAIAEGDFSQSVVHAINFLPGIGPALVKGMNKLEHLAKTVDKNRSEIINIPFVGETITSWVPSYAEKVEAAAAGGKRFSTRRRIRTKWPKTQRQRFARR